MTRQESRCGGTVMRTRNWRVVRRPHFLGARDSGMAWRVALVTRLNCILAGVLSRIFTPAVYKNKVGITKEKSQFVKLYDFTECSLVTHALGVFSH